MRKIILPILLSVLFNIVSLSAMESTTLPPLREKIRQKQYQLHPEMIAQTIEFENEQTLLSIMSPDHQPILEYNVPSTIQTLYLMQDGTLYVWGYNQETQVLFRIEKGVLNLTNDYGIERMSDMKIAPDGTLYLFGRDENGLCFITIKDGQKSQLKRYPHNNIRYLQKQAFTRDGTLVSGACDEENNPYIFAIKEGVESQVYAVDKDSQYSLLNAPDGSVYIFTKSADQDGDDYILFVKDGHISVPQNYGVLTINNVYISPDNMLYLWGYDHQDDLLVAVENGQEIARLNGFQSIANTKFEELQWYISDVHKASDNTLYLFIENRLIEGIQEEDKHIIMLVRKGGKWNVAYDDKKIKWIANIISSPEGTVYVKAKRAEGDEILTFKDGQFITKSNYGLQHISEMTLAPHEMLYLSGWNEKRERGLFVTVKGGRASGPQSYGLKNGSWSLSPTGTVYLTGTQENENNTQCLLTFRNGQKVDSTCGDWFDLIFIKGVGATFPSLLTQEEEKKIFMTQGVNMPAFMTLFAKLKLHAAESSSLFPIDGEALYHFFVPHIGQIASNAKAIREMHDLLNICTSMDTSPLYGYALALNFEGSDLQHTMYTFDPHTSKDALLLHKTEHDFKERLDQTHEVKIMLEGIIKHTSPDFSTPYVHLWEKVMAALDILDPDPINHGV